MKRKVMSMVLCGTILFGGLHLSYADSARVVTIGVDNSPQQVEKILKYFGVNKDEVVLLEVNNQEERKYLEGIASNSQLGNKTYSCSYVEPTKEGSGINVKTANLTWLTSSMVASTLSTAGLTDADVVVASTFPVSGTGALTGIMKAFEDSTGKPLEEEKKELASEELIITGDIGDDIGPDKATGIVNDIKTEIIKNNTSDTNQIANTINNVTNNYNVTLTIEQQKQLEDLMLKISQQDYDYNKMRNTLNGIKESVNDKLEEMGEDVNRDFFESVKNNFSNVGDWFSNLFKGDSEKDLGILGSTNDSILGDNAIIDATDKEAINLPSSEEVEGFFGRVWNWITNLFSSDNSKEEVSDTEIISIEEDLNEENNTFIEDTQVDDIENDIIDEDNDTFMSPDNKEDSFNDVDESLEDSLNSENNKEILNIDDKE